MVLKINLLPKQYEALAIILKAMNINFEIEGEVDDYTKKVDENLLRILSDYENKGMEVYSQEKTVNWIAEEKRKLDL